MQSKEIRKQFTNLFLSYGHKKIPSSSLIPENDPTLLFANAGMNQFKDYFTGRAIPSHRRAVTIQKCVRAGGKHNDLENVGYTARHHTFFEMLGNFSFGDYFKDDAIAFAWEFLTKCLSLPPEKLYITVHSDDDDALQIWHRKMGVPLDRIFKKDNKTNFWEMGEFGPCGPCSEIFYDHGEKYAIPNFRPGPGQDILDDDQRYVEIWNLVFMQFEKDANGIHPLPKPSIDTGAGLERIAAIMQGKYWNYDSDCFLPIIHGLEKISGKSYANVKYQTNFRVVADHIRAATMLITDGVIPSNEGRGYVLRRIIRRAIRHMSELEAPKISFHRLAKNVFEILGEEYSQNAANLALAEKMLEIEEKKFLETLDMGLKFLKEAITREKLDSKSNPILKGDSAFMLYDTFGFPLDLTQAILRDKGLHIDTERFDQLMKLRREDSKKSWKTGSSVDKSIFFQALEKFGKTVFHGYMHTECQAKLLTKIDLGEFTALIFDQTPFYAESGGQVGDTGTIQEDGHVIANVFDSNRPVEGLFAHFSKDADALQEGRTYTLKIDQKKRMLTARNHTATHLLQAALTQVLGSHIKQAGSMVSPERLRFDFTHPNALSKEELREVEKIVNEKINLHLPVSASVLEKEQAIKRGAVALFGEKYGAQVRVLEIGKFSTELCGGTHVTNTSEIGLFNIVSEGSLSAGVRRIEALTSERAIERLSRRSDLFAQTETLLVDVEEKVITKIAQLLADNKELRKENQRLDDMLTAIKGKSIYEKVEKIGTSDLLIAEIPSEIDLRKFSDDFVSNYPNGIAILAARQNNGVSILLRTSRVIESLHCGNILKEHIAMLSGKGGGRADMAQGSGRPENLGAFFSKIGAEVKTLVKK
ncbi:MAG: alanine--tRNA ligase [Bdellovibrio sp.]|nr:alanine--tRNA ligase [Bdellovibrio sp.]